MNFDRPRISNRTNRSERGGERRLPVVSGEDSLTRFAPGFVRDEKRFYVGARGPADRRNRYIPRAADRSPTVPCDVRENGTERERERDEENAGLIENISRSEMEFR